MYILKNKTKLHTSMRGGVGGGGGGGGGVGDMSAEIRLGEQVVLPVK